MKKLEIDIECPNCKRKFTQRVEEMQPGAQSRCPGCGTSIQFTGDDGRQAQKALDDFERTLKNVFR